MNAIGPKRNLLWSAPQGGALSCQNIASFGIPSLALFSVVLATYVSSLCQFTSHSARICQGARQHQWLVVFGSGFLWSDFYPFHVVHSEIRSATLILYISQTQWVRLRQNIGREAMETVWDEKGLYNQFQIQGRIKEGDECTGMWTACMHSATVTPKCHCDSHYFWYASCVLSTRPRENWRSAQSELGIVWAKEIWHSAASKCAARDATRGSKSENVIGE